MLKSFIESFQHLKSSSYEKYPVRIPLPGFLPTPILEGRGCALTRSYVTESLGLLKRAFLRSEKYILYEQTESYQIVVYI